MQLIKAVSHDSIRCYFMKQQSRTRAAGTQYIVAAVWTLATPALLILPSFESPLLRCLNCKASPPKLPPYLQPLQYISPHLLTSTLYLNLTRPNVKNFDNLNLQYCIYSTSMIVVGNLSLSE